MPQVLPDGRERSRMELRCGPARAPAEARPSLSLQRLARAGARGAPWRIVPNDLPPWETVYQQSRRWLDADCFEAMVSDLRSIIRVAQGRPGTAQRRGDGRAHTAIELRE